MKDKNLLFVINLHQSLIQALVGRDQYCTYSTEFIVESFWK